MKKAGLLNVFSLVFNLLIIAAVIYTSVVLFAGQVFDRVHLFSVLSSFVLTLTTLICLPFNIVGMIKKKRLPKAIYIFKLVGVTTSLMALLMTVTILGYVNGWDIAGLLGNFDLNSPSLFLLLIVPVLGMVGFIFFDHTETAKFPVNLFSLIPMLAYSAFYIVNSILNFYADPILNSYEWYGIGAIHKLAVPIVFAALVVLAFLASILLYLLNRGLLKAFFKASEQVESEPVQKESQPMEEPSVIFQEEHVEEETNKDAPAEEESDEGAELEEASEESVEEEPVEEPVEEVEEESIEEEVSDVEAPIEEEVNEELEEEPTSKAPKTTKKTTKKSGGTKKATPKKVAPKDTSTTSNGTKVYHLTKRKEDGMWAITFVGGKKPVKLFKTKKEAEEYLSVLTKNQGATALIRNSKGAKAGKFASSIKSDEDKK